MKSIRLAAKLDNLDTVLDFINAELEQFDCQPKAQMQIAIAVEEIFVNIAHYAYNPIEGEATVCFEISEDPLAVTVQFLDQGTPYNPLDRADPDITLSAEERQIGGLGIFMVKKSMDNISYEYKDGKNVLTILKKVE